MVIIVYKTAFKQLLNLGLEAISSMTDLHCQNWRNYDDSRQTDQREDYTKSPLIESHVFRDVAGDDRENFRCKYEVQDFPIW